MENTPATHNRLVLLMKILLVGFNVPCSSLWASALLMILLMIIRGLPEQLKLLMILRRLLIMKKTTHDQSRSVAHTFACPISMSSTHDPLMEKFADFFFTHDRARILATFQNLRPPTPPQDNTP